MLARISGWLLIGLLSCGSALAAEPRWEADISQFEKQDREAHFEPVEVMFYGSSSFRLWKDLKEVFPNVSLVNRGFGGSQLSDLNDYFDRVVIRRKPQLLLIYGGDNDLASGKSPAVVLEDFQKLVAKVRQHLPRTRVGFVAVKPSPSREKLLAAQHEANALVRRFARRTSRVDFIDAATPLLNQEGQPDPKYFVEDRLHLNSEGYEEWEEVLKPYFRRWLGRDSAD